VDAVAVAARLVHHPGEHHGFAGLELDALRERGGLARLHVVGDAFGVGQCAMLAPDPAGPARHLAVLRKFGLRYWRDKTIDIAHVTSLAGRHAERVGPILGGHRPGRGDPRRLSGAHSLAAFARDDTMSGAHA